MCNNCIHKAVCSKFAATGGHVRECEHFREDRKGEWDVCEDDFLDETIYKCPFCKSEVVTVDGLPASALWNYCPNCGADMK